MALGEFDLIGKYFAGHAGRYPHVVLGVGDDAAILACPPGEQQVISCDTLVSGVHFPLSSAPACIGHKALAVNLSDLAAMGARPAWCMLALTLPEVDADWLDGFARGFLALADQHQCPLVGGDTTRGPLAITVTVGGFVPAGRALRRDGAQIGDVIAVTGSLGDAGAGLAHVLGQRRLADAAFLQSRLEQPTPRVAAGLLLRDHAHAAIDVSDGLLADLGHICARSQCAAQIDCAALPLSAPLRAQLGNEAAELLALTAGDDYELCVTLPAAALAAAQKALAAQSLSLTPVGRILAGSGVHLQRNGQACALPGRSGFRHF